MIEYPRAYAVYNKNENVRLESTSGGVFTVLAEYFIEEKKAVVYGAAFDEQFNIHHVRVCEIRELALLRGSKYPQSNMGKCFLQIKEDLNNGLNVFFTGTPCQIVALKNFLTKPYDNLYCMDFVCHGVASAGVWRDYIKMLNRKGTIKNIVFKKKYKGWKKWYFQVIYDNGNTIQRRGYMTMFMRSYLSYSNIRPSCFECMFKGLNRISDFTISDCWGIGEQDKEMNDDKGLSALLIHNDRAFVVFEKIRKKIRFKEYNAYDLMKGNWTTFKSVVANDNRGIFFKNFADYGGEYALKKFYKPSLKDWISYRFHVMRGDEK